MDFLLALSGKDFVVTLHDTTTARSIVVMKHDEDKSWPLTPHSLLLASGEPGDVTSFVEYMQRNIRLYGIRHEVELSTHAAANFIRRKIADDLRTREAKAVNLLLAGVDGTRPSIYWIDYIGALIHVPFAIQGYGQHFLLSLLDRHYRPDLELEQVLELARMCAKEMKKRFIVQFAGWKCQVVDKNGVRELKDWWSASST